MSHRPRKHFGQHFLHDPVAIERIIRAVHPKPGQNLVEIGPGEGVLTRPLLAAAGRLEVVEIDRDLAARLRATSDWPGELVVHECDALAFDFSALQSRGPLRLVGNLPYNISTPLLFHLLARPDVIRDMHFMLQREVVDRLAAAPGNRARGRLSVMVQAQCRVEPLIRLGPGAFRPPPAVDSAVVRLTLLPEPAVAAADQPRFAEIVRRAFGGRRKTLRNTLAPMMNSETISAAGVDPRLRPEQLSVADFARLARAGLQPGAS